MALILDESFLTGIPGSFATARQAAGTLTATYNSGAQAVDLTNATAGHSLYDITSQALRATGEFEIDIEIVADVYGGRHAGAWAVYGQANVSNGVRYWHNGYAWGAEVWSGGVNFSGLGTAILAVSNSLTSLQFNTFGDRRVLNMRWDTSPTQNTATLEFRIDGTLVGVYAGPLSAIRPGVFLYQCTVRLHSIKVWDAPQASLTALTSSGLAAAVSRRICAPPEALVSGGPRRINRGAVLGQRNIYQGGGGRVAGTVKEKNLPANTPLRRRVQLIDEGTRLLVRESWSDATTGAYSFDYVDMARKYTVMSYDHTGAYRAVVADGQIPELIV